MFYSFMLYHERSLK